MGTTIHASCVVLARAAEPFGAPVDAGVLLVGPSGSGKSDLALRLIAIGAVLVADDRTELFIHNEVLMAQPPQTLAGLLEIRTVGIIEMEYARAAAVALVCALTQDTIRRLPEPDRYAPPGIDLAEEKCPPLLRLNPFEASAPAKIAAAVAAHVHRQFRNYPNDS